MLKGFPPIADDNTHTLILGSFPGVASLVATQYYAHPRNQFWRLVGSVIGEPLNELPYDERVLKLLKPALAYGTCSPRASAKAVSTLRSATPTPTISRHFAFMRRG